MAKKEPEAIWPFPKPGVGRALPTAAGRARPTEPDAAPPKPSTPSLGGSYTLDDASGELTLIERTQQPEGCTRHLAPQPKE